MNFKMFLALVIAFFIPMICWSNSVEQNMPLVSDTCICFVTINKHSFNACHVSVIEEINKISYNSGWPSAGSKDQESDYVPLTMIHFQNGYTIQVPETPQEKVVNLINTSCGVR